MSRRKSQGWERSGNVKKNGKLRGLRDQEGGK